MSPSQITQPNQIDDAHESVNVAIPPEQQSENGPPGTPSLSVVSLSQTNETEETEVPSQFATPVPTDEVIQPKQKPIVLGSGKYFSMDPYKRMIPEVVDKLPHNINGKRFYMLDVGEDEKYTDKYKDGRFFAMHSSRRKGFRGIRKVGTCQGNYQCLNDSCPFYLVEEKRNSHHFNNIGGKKFCYSCESLAIRQHCGALKCIEYNQSGELLEVFHLGKHKCQSKPRPQEDDKFLKDNIRQFGTTLGPKELAKAKMGEELRIQMSTGEYDMNKIVQIAAKFTDGRKIANLKKKIDTELRSERHSMSAVAELKQVTDTTDPYLIYKVNDSSFNNNDDFVFKSSRKMAQLAINMDQNSPGNNPLKGEFCYFDGMHLCCKKWKTLTLWVYHPTSRRLMRLATMEVKSEDTHNCRLFWKLWNQLLSEVKGEAYSFNPIGFITDEAGCNANGIRQIFGEGVRKTYSCQFHFMQCLQRQLRLIPGNLAEIRSEFEVLALQLLSCTTLLEYNEIKRKLELLGGVVQSINSWLNWWVQRRFNLFPIFRGYCISSLNLAEIGHSTLKRKKQLMLVDAAWEDVATMMLQEQEHTLFLQGIHKSMGKGPSIAQIAVKEKSAQRKRSKDYQQSFKAGVFCISEQVGQGSFIPSKHARHRAPTTPAIQGSFQDPPPPLNSIENIHPSQNSNNPPSTSVQIQNSMGNVGTFGYLEVSGTGTLGQNPQGANRRGLTKEQADTLTNNPPMLCFLHGTMARCQGCRTKFSDTMRVPPNDLLVKMSVVKPRLINGKWVPGWQKSWGYFHLNLSCLQRHLSFVEVEDIYVPNAVRCQVQLNHINKLKKMGWWEQMRMRHSCTRCNVP